MVSLANAGLWPQLPGLWRTCFEDGAYADLVFSALLVPEQVLVAQQDGVAAAILCMQPFELVAPAAAFKGVYIFGVATLPQYRGRGLSTRLLTHAHAHLSRQGYALSVLVPANAGLFRFYAARGYETTFSACRTAMPAPQGESGVVLAPADLVQLAPLRDAYFSTGRQYVRWDARFLSFVQREAGFLNGHVLTFGQGERRGYAVCHYMDGTVHIKELAVHEEDFSAVVRAICTYYGAQRYEARLPVDFDCPGIKNCLPFAMTKWYDREKSGAASVGCTSPGYIAHVLD